LSDIFNVSKTGRETRNYLSNYSISRLGDIESLCRYHESPETFWIPSVFEKETLANSWFNYFGTPSIESQLALEKDYISLEYLNLNYPKGINEEEVEEYSIDKDFEINLRSFSMAEKETKENDLKQLKNIDKLSILKSKQKLLEKTKLHENIVQLLAKKLHDLNYQVSEDRNSVDILAKKEDYEAILEVKTVNKRNLFKHLRLGVGQLSEYRYRRKLQTKKYPESILVISSDYQFPDWLLSYFNEEINTGLLCRVNEDKFKSYTNKSIEKAVCLV